MGKSVFIKYSYKWYTIKLTNLVKSGILEKKTPMQGGGGRDMKIYLSEQARSELENKINSRQSETVHIRIFVKAYG